jgi:predicted PurR-regulated permease PerM
MRTIAITAAVAVALLAAWVASDVLFLVFGAALFATVFGAAADWIAAHTSLGRGKALTIILIALAGIVALGGWIVVPQAREQIRELSDKLPDAFQNFMTTLSASDLGAQIVREIHNLEGSAAQHNLWSRIMGVFSTALGAIAGAVLVVFLTIYFAAQPDLYKRALLLLFPKERRQRLGEVYDEVAETLRWWFIGKVLLMIYVAIATSIGLAALGIPLAITLGILAGLLDFVPNFGPITAAIPTALIAFARSPMDAFWVIILYTAVQVSENHVLTPIVQRKAVRLYPAMTLFAQAFLGVIFGVIGLLFATPIAAAALILVKRLWVEDYRHEKAA